MSKAYILYVFGKEHRGHDSRQVHSRTFRGDKEHFIEGRMSRWELVSGEHLFAVVCKEEKGLVRNKHCFRNTRTQWEPFPSPPSQFDLRRVPTTSHRGSPQQTPSGPFAWCQRPFDGRSLPCIVPGSAPSNNV